MQIKEIKSPKEISEALAFLEKSGYTANKNRVSNLVKNGYRMAASLNKSGKINGFVGVKISEKLQHGKILEIEDFVIESKEPQDEATQNLLNWIEILAKKLNAKSITTSCTTNRTDIQKVFSIEKFIIEGLSFRLTLNA